jgi:hypothetical protein
VRREEEGKESEGKAAHEDELGHGVGKWLLPK